jgi:hypothetical protein
MANFEVDNSGFRADVQGVLRRLGSYRGGVLKDAALVAEAATKGRFAPQDTGALAGGITGTVDGDGAGATLRTNGQDYAAIQEFDETLNHPGGGEQGAHYIRRGGEVMVENAMEAAEKRYPELWRV